MTELDAKLRHKLQEREQLVHQLLLKLQRSPSEQPASASECASDLPAATGNREQKSPQQLIGSSRLMEACAELAAVSKKFDALKTPVGNSRKSFRVLFFCKCVFAVNMFFTYLFLLCLCALVHYIPRVLRICFSSTFYNKVLAIISFSRTFQGSF